MTFVVAPPGEARDRHDAYELVGSAEAAQYISAASLVDGQVGRVGLETEAHCIDLSDPQRRPSWSEIGAVIADIGPLPGRSRITLEPGGAVELSGPPADGPVAAIAAMSADRAVLHAAFAEAGLGLLLLGADPLRRPQRINPGDRYAAMEQFFAASGTAEAGDAMMTSTASIQVNPRRARVKAGPEE